MRYKNLSLALSRVYCFYIYWDVKAENQCVSGVGGLNTPNSSGSQRSRCFTAVVKTAVSQLRVMMANRDPCSEMLTELKSY